MEHLYAVKSQKELLEYERFVSKIQPRLTAYLTFLKDAYQVCQLPRTIVWTSCHGATELFSDIPVPAYTNDYRVVMTPDVSAWRSVYLHQLDGLEAGETGHALRAYYETGLTENHILQILGHELAHHSPLFLDDFDSSRSNGIWFEEGMAEYISRRYFLTPSEYEAEYRCNKELVGLLNHKYGGHSLEEFGAATYAGDYASIFFEYWRSFLAIHQIVQKHGGDVRKVFASYHRWHETEHNMTLLDWFSGATIGG
ncbi:MAG: hypothetical protein Q4F17_02635 [Eubacteriales bacterium]|nr:hypothetical protein [Eubacteriales bacterium]